MNNWIGKLSMWLYLKITPCVPFTALNTALRKLDGNATSVLDLGCGRGRTARSIKKRGYYLAGLDIYLPCVLVCREKGHYNDLILGDVTHPPFKPKSFDIVWCLEVLEHQNKEDGLRLIKEMEDIARRLVIISTPEGSYPHKEIENPYQEHLSTWCVEDLKAMGYKVYGHGHKSLRGKIEFDARLPVWLKPVLYVLWVLSGPFVYFIPGWSSDMVAVKRLDR